MVYLLNFGFLICKVGIITASIAHNCLKNNEILHLKHLKPYLGYEKCHLLIWYYNGKITYRFRSYGAFKSVGKTTAWNTSHRNLWSYLSWKEWFGQQKEERTTIFFWVARASHFSSLIAKLWINDFPETKTNPTSRNYVIIGPALGSHSSILLTWERETNDKKINLRKWVADKAKNL